MAKGPKDIAAEAHEEEREAEKPGARGKEYRDREREGDEGQAYKRGGGMKHGHHRERGGYMPEETEASMKERGRHQMGKTAKQEKEPDGADEKEGKEAYPDVNLKRGGAAKRHKRARGGGLDAAKEHKVHLPHHHARKHGGKVPGHEAKSRPDRRARGGATADLYPETAASNMSIPEYQKQHELPRRLGIGPDKTNIYSAGSHRRPG
jgi:hypothetical protein